MNDITKWKWCGFPHHFIASDKCNYSLATYVADGNYLVSTVGDYRVNNDEPVMFGDEYLYETMVFRCDPKRLVDNEPTVSSWSEIERVLHKTSSEANSTHIQICFKYDSEALNV